MQRIQKNLLAHLNVAKKCGYLLMLDFDGVLSPIVAQPKKARMAMKTKKLLESCARYGHVAVISGRALSDIKKRVGLSDVWYAGNHGNEWTFGKSRGRTQLSRIAHRDIRTALSRFRKLLRCYPGAIAEDKGITFSLHFRQLSRSRIIDFKRAVRETAKGFPRLDIAEGDEYLFNVRHATSRTKGDAVRLARTLVAPRALPIFIGDDTTDEDAFKALPRGITIRVGRRRGSAARFFVRSRSDVDTILKLLASR